LIRLRRELADMLGERIDLAAPQLLAPEMAKRVLAEAVPL
jgi:predicted nucleotidyltransferase